MGKTGAFFTGAADDEDRDGQPVILFTAIDSSEYRLNHCQHSGDCWILLHIEEAFTAVMLKKTKHLIYVLPRGPMRDSRPIRVDATRIPGRGHYHYHTTIVYGGIL